MHPRLLGWHWRQQTGGGDGWWYGGLRGPPHAVRRSRMRTDPRTRAQSKKVCVRQVTANFCVRVEDAVRPRGPRARSVCCVSELARAGLSAFPKLSEFRKCLAGGRWRLRLEGIMPSEMRLRGSRSRGGLKGAEYTRSPLRFPSTRLCRCFLDLKTLRNTIPAGTGASEKSHSIPFRHSCPPPGIGRRAFIPISRSRFRHFRRLFWALITIRSSVPAINRPKGRCGQRLPTPNHLFFFRVLGFRVFRV